MMTEPQTDHRKAQRRHTLKGGRIVFNNGRSTFDCIVRNLSRQQPCKVIWRKAKEIGIEFIGVN